MLSPWRSAAPTAVRSEEAKLVADHLVLANLYGHDSHGVGMMPAYIQNTTTGRCIRNHHAKIIKDNGAVVVIDGGVGYGQVVAKETMDIGIERARKHGVCVIGLTNAHHIGRIGHWAEQCARAGMVSTHWVNVHGHKSLVAPFGGAEPRYLDQPLLHGRAAQGQGADRARLRHQPGGDGQGPGRQQQEDPDGARPADRRSRRATPPNPA